MKTSELRKTFLEFFRSRGHKVFPSDTLIPKDDPTLLFTSAGMNQFKDYFLGRKKDTNTAVSCQRCLRTGDLDNVGKTAYHHTFFEMLGNFSFGGYFKEKAILLAWEFLTKELNLKPDSLWVSVYYDDDDAYHIWKETIGISSERIVKLGAEDNFWPSNALALGPNGPCGPCSEIYFDWGKSRGCGKDDCSPSCGCGRFVEIWNLVFTQFNRIGVNKVEDLPSKNIDTGMGLERMSAVLQGKETNFGIDVLKPLVDEVRLILKGGEPGLVNAVSDHVRAVTFAVSDGIYPSNESRGYVIRRILRRALWFGFSLGRKKPFLYKLVPLISDLYKDFYPELFDNKDVISKIIFSEEERFISTLEKGKEILFSYIDSAVKKGRDAISGKDLFLLYDTYGFPCELTENIAREKGLKVDIEGFNSLLNEQKKSSREKSGFDESVFADKGVNLGVSTEFTGYDCLETEAVIKYILKGEEILDNYSGGDTVSLVLDKTPFYPLSGGQLADKGVIESNGGDDFIFIVDKAEKIDKAILHIGRIKQGQLKEGRKVKALVNKERRQALARAHTSTHLLQAALRRVLGSHVQQQGSFVDEDFLRFDFNHFKGLDYREIRLVEEEVNSKIAENIEVSKTSLSFEDAKKEGALAFFEEKYSDKVRMVTVEGVSKELCGGTHLERTSEAMMFMVAGESSISSGVRRIEAVTGRKAVEQAVRYRENLKELSRITKVPVERLDDYLREVVSKNKQNDKELFNLRKKLFEESEAEKILSSGSVLKNGVNLYIFELKNVLPDFLRLSLDLLRKRRKEKSVFLGFLSRQEKVVLNMAATKDLVDRGFSCKEACSKIALGFGGSGGGRPDFGFAGMKQNKNISSKGVKDSAEKIIETMVRI